ncbi:unnamed protein product [Medioppia subpectinata]|uniref:Uncharacterized protein n=1 Tax=Medioppia subpectinata TaxID=1979941 RepID=A0A7R9PVH8_9ACAR|nr:unnamed protein product [Medioppia subpectinata]CAG2102701.1 unnamed protein product [Medioppia subpectinata]
MVSEADAYRQYVVIGHDLWSLKHTDSANDTIKTVSIDDQNSGHSDWFGADYSMAICLLFNGHESSEAPGDHGITGLMKTGSKDIEWALLNKDLKIIKRLNKTTVPYDMTATMAWVMNYEKTKPDYIHLRHVLLWDGFQITGRFFGDYKKPENNEDGDTRHQTLYNQMLSNRTVIAVLGQGVVGQKYDDSVIVLFQFDHQIKYCYANLSQDDHKMPEMCRPENLKTLIDCNSNSWYLILILLIILIVITIAVIIGIVSHMFQNRKTTQIGAK